MERELSVACPSMTGRLRWLIAAGFVLLFFLIPSPETSAGRSNLATLRVRAWLLDAEGPLAGAVKERAIPPLAVEFRMSPPDEALAARCSAEIARIAAVIVGLVRGEDAAKSQAVVRELCAQFPLP